MSQNKPDTEAADDLFVARSACPTCRRAGQQHLALPFTDPRVRDFVHDYYEGRVPLQQWSRVDYRLDRCPQCGLVWQHWILNETGMQRLYTEWISAEHSLAKKVGADAALFAGYAREMAAIASLCASRPKPFRVLDYGMGWGYWCRMAQAFGFEAYGYEISEQRRHYAQCLGVRSLANMAQLRKQRFDFINCEQVIEHVADPQGVLRELVHNLVPGGWLRVSVPDGQGVIRQMADPAWRAGKDAVHPLEHVNCFNHDALCHLAQSVGLHWVAGAPVDTENSGTALYFTQQPHRPRRAASHAAPVARKPRALVERVCCVVRSIGEQTTSACIRLLQREFAGQKDVVVHRVGDSPFIETLAASLRAGLGAEREWTLCVDADVLPLPGALQALLAQAERLDTSFIEVQPLVFDRLFAGWRPAGVHLYRTAQLPEALRLLDEVRDEIRPESALLEKLALKGFRWHQSGLAFGLHDFGQTPADIRRTCFLHAWKHVHLIPNMLQYWRQRQQEPDFAAAIAGLAAGISHNSAVMLEQGITSNNTQAAPPRRNASEAVDVMRLLDQERARLHSLGYESAPVWDWAEIRWPQSHREAILTPAFARLVELGVRRVTLVADNPVAAHAFAMESAQWGIDVVASGSWWQPVTTAGQNAATVHVDSNGELAVHHAGKRHRVSFSYDADWPPHDYQVAAARLIQRMQAASIKCFVIYGAGSIAEAIVQAARVQGLSIEACIVSSPRSSQPDLFGIPVMATEPGLHAADCNDVVIASYAFMKPMVARVLEHHEAQHLRIWCLDA